MMVHGVVFSDIRMTEEGYGFRLGGRNDGEGGMKLYCLLAASLGR